MIAKVFISASMDLASRFVSLALKASGTFSIELGSLKLLQRLLHFTQVTQKPRLSFIRVHGSTVLTHRTRSKKAAVKLTSMTGPSHHVLLRARDLSLPAPGSSPLLLLSLCPQRREPCLLWGQSPETKRPGAEGRL